MEKPSTAPQAGTPEAESSTRAELEAMLSEDDSLLGEVYRRTEAGETAEQIRAARGADTPHFVWNYLRTIRALLNKDDLPEAPSVAMGTARRFRRLLRDRRFTPATRAELERRLGILEERSADTGARRAEDRQAVEDTSRAEQNAIPGIYVYALPHYVRHPYDEDSGHTLLKVGRADRSVIQRFRGQTRTTALPEDPVLLRVYPCDEEASRRLETKIHTLLEAADHDRSAARTGGTEWFLTSLRFLDEIASTLSLEIREVTPLADVLE
ncbi:MAG: GIY-YIG nuclease family protein [Actinomycetota bacterium]